MYSYMALYGHLRAVYIGLELGFYSGQSLELR